MMCEKGKVDEMERIQRRFIRLVKNDKDTEINELYDNLKVVSVNDRIRINVLKLIDKLVTHRVPVKLANEFIVLNTIRSRILRNADCLKYKSFKKKAGCNSIFFKGIIEYNSFKKYIRNAKNKKCNF